MPFSIAISMRCIEKQYPSGSVEIYNALAETWFDFLLSVFPEASCLILPSSKQSSFNIVNTHKIDLLILSGGDDIGTFPQRDETEFALLAWAEENNIPVLGVCRGMQVINAYYGGTVEEDRSHVACRHAISFENKYTDIYSKNINSYHANSITKSSIASSLTPLAQADNNLSIEALKHKNKPIYGIMWHPERESPFQQTDINLFMKIVESK